MLDLIPRPVLPVLAALALLAPAAGVAGQQPEEGARAAGARGWIGISFGYDVPCEDCDVPAGAGAIEIKRVFQGSPAERAGLRPGDVLVGVDGRSLDPEALVRFASRLRPGQEVRIRVRRDDSVRDMELVADRRPSLSEAPVPPEVATRLDSVRSALIRRFDSLRAGIRPMPPLPPTPGVGRAQRPPVPDSVRVRLRSLQEELLRAWREERQMVADARRSGRGLDEEERRRLQELGMRADTLQLDLQRLYRSMATDAARSAARAMEGMERAERQRSDQARSRGAGRVEVAPRPPSPHLLGRDFIAGARMTDLNPGLSEYFGVERGVLVTEVLADSPAQEAGLAAGDVIVSAAEESTSSVDELRRSLARASRWPVPLRIVRKGEETSLRLRR